MIDLSTGGQKMLSVDEIHKRLFGHSINRRKHRCCTLFLWATLFLFVPIILSGCVDVPLTIENHTSVYPDNHTEVQWIITVPITDYNPSIFEQTKKIIERDAGGFVQDYQDDGRAGITMSEFYPTLEDFVGTYSIPGTAENPRLLTYEIYKDSILQFNDRYAVYISVDNRYFTSGNLKDWENITFRQTLTLPGAIIQSNGNAIGSDTIYWERKNSESDNTVLFAVADLPINSVERMIFTAIIAISVMSILIDFSRERNAVPVKAGKANAIMGFAIVLVLSTLLAFEIAVNTGLPDNIVKTQAIVAGLSIVFVAILQYLGLLQRLFDYLEDWRATLYGPNGPIRRLLKK